MTGKSAGNSPAHGRQRDKLGECAGNDVELQVTSAGVQALIVHTTLLVDGREVSLDKRDIRFYS